MNALIVQLLASVRGMNAGIVKLVARWWRKPAPVPVKRHVREYEVTDTGLAPVYAEPDLGEPMLDTAAAEAFLDSITLDDWRRHGPMPGTVVNGRMLYAQSDLVAWVEGVDDFNVDPTTGEKMIRA